MHPNYVVLNTCLNNTKINEPDVNVNLYVDNTLESNWGRNNNNGYYVYFQHLQ